MDERHVDDSPTARILTSDPWISRFYRSALLSQSNGPAGSDVINVRDQETYGDPKHDVLFRIGNGGAGYTGLIGVLANAYIAQQGDDFRIGWVTNHSRHSQIALLAGVVHIALTYEPDNEDLAIEEGWARRSGRVLNDHFILVGPDIDLGVKGLSDALRIIAGSHAATSSSIDEPGHVKEGAKGHIIFHTRGDGSATFARETLLLQTAEVDVNSRDWIKTYPLSPYDALVKAENERAFLLTDRATFLTAKRDGIIPSLHVHIEGGQELLNPCSAILKSLEFASKDSLSDQDREADKAAAHFASWLASNQAQSIIRDYGRQWGLQKPLFNVGDEDDFPTEDRMLPIRPATTVPEGTTNSPHLPTTTFH